MIIKCIKDYGDYFTQGKKYEAEVKGVYLNAIDNRKLSFTVAYNREGQWDKDEFFREHFKIVG